MFLKNDSCFQGAGCWPRHPIIAGPSTHADKQITTIVIGWPTSRKLGLDKVRSKDLDFAHSKGLRD